MYDLDKKNVPETFFYRAATSWGWATWARAWKNFEPDIDKLISQFDAKKVDQFTRDGSMNFWKQMREFKAGKNNSWAIRWYAFWPAGTARLATGPSASALSTLGPERGRRARSTCGFPGRSSRHCEGTPRFRPPSRSGHRTLVAPRGSPAGSGACAPRAEPPSAGNTRPWSRSF